MGVSMDGAGMDGGECGWGWAWMGAGMDRVVGVDQAADEAWLEERC